MSPYSIPNPRQAVLSCLLALGVAIACGALLTAAALVPAPPAAVPFLVAVCIACPVFAAWEIPLALAVLRTRGVTRQVRPLDSEAVGELRRGLDSLPETDHPLGY